MHTKILKYLDNLKLNREVILNSELNHQIKRCYRLMDGDFLINNHNLKKISKSYLKNLSIKTIVIDCNLINIFKMPPIKNIEQDLKKDNFNTLEKIRFKNIYLVEGNKIIQSIFNKIKIILNNQNIDISKTTFKIKNYDSNLNYFLNDLSNLITAYQMKDKKERYTFIYEEVSIELDKRFRVHNVCGFHNDLCSNKVCLQHKYDLKRLKTGCCFTKGRVCPNLDKDHCKINCLACKFFTCYPLRLKGIYYRPRDFLLIKNFFNSHQIMLLRDTLFTDKDDMVKILLKEKKVPKTPIEY